MSETKSALMAQAAKSSDAPPAATGPTQAVSPRGRFFANPTFHFETLRNAGYIVSNCADLGEILETVKVISEGDAQNWYAAWEDTADRVLALAERTQDSLSKGGAYMRAATYQRMAEFLLPPDDSKRPKSFEKIGSHFFKGLDMLGVRYERITISYGAGKLRALYFPGPQQAQTKPLLMFGGGFDSILEEYYPNFAEAALKRGYSVLTYEGPGQGQALRKYGPTYTPEWEKPVKAGAQRVPPYSCQAFENCTYRHEHGRLFRAARRRLRRTHRWRGGLRHHVRFRCDSGSTHGRSEKSSRAEQYFRFVGLPQCVVDHGYQERGRDH